MKRFMKRCLIESGKFRGTFWRKKLGQNENKARQIFEAEYLEGKKVFLVTNNRPGTNMRKCRRFFCFQTFFRQNVEGEIPLLERGGKNPIASFTFLHLKYNFQFLMFFPVNVPFVPSWSGWESCSRWFVPCILHPGYVVKSRYCIGKKICSMQ